MGGVTDDGVDVAGTLHFGEHFQFYDAVSWNQSHYDDNYSTVTNGVSTVVPIAGKQVPIVPNWLNRFIFSTNWDGFEAQVSGDFIGRRYATYLNDWRVGASFIAGLEASYSFDMGDGDWVKKLKISGNITNLADVKGASTITVHRRQWRLPGLSHPAAHVLCDGRRRALTFPPMEKGGAARCRPFFCSPECRG